MKLHSKIYLLLLFFSIAIILYFISFHFINTSIKNIFTKENQDIQQHTIENVIAINLNSYQQIIEDNSAWDELIDFTQKQDSVWAIDNIDFIVNVFGQSTVMVYNKDHQLIHFHSDSTLTGQIEPPAPEKIDSLFNQASFCHYFQYSGDKLFEYFGANIVPSSDAIKRQTPAQGYLLSGQEWNREFLDNLAESTGFATEIVKMNDLPSFKMDSGYEYVLKELSDSNGKTIAKVIFSRANPVEQELKTFLYLTILVSLIALVVVIVFLVYIKRIIMHPLSVINRTLHKHDLQYIQKMETKTPEFIELKELILNSFKQQEELRKNNDQLRESNATKDKLFSIIGHDLRNPIGNILSASGLLSESIQNNELEHADVLANLVEDESRGALNLLETLLNWAKSQTGTIHYNPKRFQIKEIIAQVAFKMETSAQLKEIQIDTTGVCDIEVFADQNMLTTILRNLISNAIKFTNPGGCVKVAVSQNGRKIDIMVEDNGIGMDESTVKRLFKTETNYSTYGTANEKGTGLGLIICKEFADKHSGSIRVESEKGKGTRFIVSLLAHID